MTTKNKDNSHQLALIICTRNRPTLLLKLLNSIEHQNIRPRQIIIVDGSDDPIISVIHPFLTVNDSYVHVYPPSLTKQKNEGIRQLHKEITIAGYLDDDTELEHGAVEEMLNFWDHCPPDTGGAEFNIINDPGRLEPNSYIKNFFYNIFLLYRTIFFLDNIHQGRVLRSGINTTMFPITKDIQCQWLSGGATVWKREILDNNIFDEFYRGWAYFEDLEFSYRISKDYQLFVVHKSRITHNPPPFNKDKSLEWGRMRVIDRYYFVKKNPELSKILFFWSVGGDIMFKFLSSFITRNRDGLRYAKGALTGVIYIIRGDLRQREVKFRE